MKKLYRSWVVGALALLATVPMLSANQIQVGYSGSAYGPYQTGQGGEFTLNDVNPDGWLDLSAYAGAARNVGPAGISSFQSFCIEGGENISGYPATYNAVINQNALYGGMGATGDPISVGTGWLYKQFATAAWDAAYGLSYNYLANRAISAGALQNAIWWLEGEKAIVYNGANPYMAAVVARFGSETDAKADGGWQFGVFALNLTAANGGRAQDQLYCRPVPDGGLTAMLLGLGLGGVAVVSRRIRK